MSKLFDKNLTDTYIHKPIGLIGGMGPHASAYFYKLLLDKSTEKYGAKNNDDFPEIILDSLPVPDFISNTNNLSVAKKMLFSRVKLLTKFDCGAIGMVCNTGHLLQDNFVELSDGRFVSMIDSVAKYSNLIRFKKVGIFATPVTIDSKIYDKSLSKFGINVVYPCKSVQQFHEQLIRSFISGNKNLERKEKLKSITEKFVKTNKLDGIILGCTELPLIFPKMKNVKIVDCMNVLADELLSKYYNE